VCERVCVCEREREEERSKMILTRVSPVLCNLEGERARERGREGKR